MNQEIKREGKRILIYECQCDESLKGKVEESARLTYSWVVWGTGTPNHGDEVKSPSGDIHEEEGCLHPVTRPHSP